MFQTLISRRIVRSTNCQSLIGRRRAAVSPRASPLSTYSVAAAPADQHHPTHDNNAPNDSCMPLIAATAVVRPSRKPTGAQELAVKSLVDELLAKQTFAPSPPTPMDHSEQPAPASWDAGRNGNLPSLTASVLVGIRGMKGEHLTSVTTKSYALTAAVSGKQSCPTLQDDIDFDKDTDKKVLDRCIHEPLGATDAEESTSATLEAAAASATPSTNGDNENSTGPEPESDKESAAASTPRSSTDTEPANLSNENRQQPHPLIATLSRCVQFRNTPQALAAFYDLLEVTRQARQYRQEPPIPSEALMKKLYRLTCPRRPFDAYQVLRYYMTLQNTTEFIKGDGDINAYSAMWERLCDSLRHLDPEKHAPKDIENLVRTVSAKVKRMERPAQELCCPVLVSALLEQRSVKVGYEFAEPIYSYIVREDFRVPDGWFIHLLSFSKYNRQYDLPFEDVLERSLGLGRRPPPVIVLQVLDNFFPFTDTEPVTRVLKAILQLQQEVIESAAKEGIAVDPKGQYMVDIGVLEMIGAAAASQGSTDINLLVWDMLDLLGYEPTAGIYENTVMAFAMNTFTYKEAFTVLAEMEASGYEPSRALIRSCSAHLRNSATNLEFALEQLRLLHQEGKAVTTSAWNCVLSGASERGDVDGVLTLWSELERCDIVPNAESYSFVFESLGKNLRRHQRFETYRNPQDHIDASITLADSYLSKMETQGISPTQHIVREYIEMLCLVRQVDTATAIVLESLQKGEEHLISDKTIYRVALANAKLQQFDVARRLAGSRRGAEPIEFLFTNIEREERAMLGGFHDDEDEAVGRAPAPRASNSDQMPPDEEGCDDYRE